MRKLAGLFHNDHSPFFFSRSIQDLSGPLRETHAERWAIGRFAGWIYFLASTRKALVFLRVATRTRQNIH